MTKVIGGVIPPKEHRKLKLEDKVNYTLDRLIFSRTADMSGVRKDCIYRPEDMGPMWICGDNNLLFNSPDQINHPRLIWPLEIGVVFHGRNSEWGDHLHCVYGHSIDATKLRGSYKFVGRHNIAVYDAFLQSNGEWLPSVNYASWHGTKWLNAGRIRYSEVFLRNVRQTGGAPVKFDDPTGEGELSIGERAAMAQSMALTYRYEWGAQFSVPGSPRLIIPVTPEGIFELFNDRNKPQDKDRRAALRHWVSQHLRKKTGGNFTKVRDHLRGEVNFNWRGFDVTVRPSAFDNDRNSMELSA